MTHTLAPRTDAQGIRAESRYSARHTLWVESLPGSRVRNCGRAVRRNGVGVEVKVTECGGRRSTGFGNLQHCGLVWVCPVCSAKIAASRQDDISRALSAWYGGVAPVGSDVVPAFGRVALVTLTMRHNKGHSLSALWGALSESWNVVASGRGWAADQLRHGEHRVAMVERRSGKDKGKLIPTVRGSIPVIRVVEVTVGANGWHVHIHALLMLPRAATASSVAVLGHSMWTRWLSALEARGLDCDREHGVDIRLLKGDPGAALGEYFTKAVYQGSMEVVASGMKSAGRGNRTPFAVLADVVRLGDVDDLDTWHEFERGSKGRRQITWSHGLRARLLPDLPVESTDQELVDVAPGGDVVAEVNGDVWRAVVRERLDWKLKRAFEVSNRDGFRLLFEIAERAADASACEWARLLAESDPSRRLWQTRDVA